MDLTHVIAAAVTLMLAIVTYILYPYIVQKVSAEELAKIKMWVNIAVKAAEMLYEGSGRGEEKKAYVVEFLKNRGFKLDTEAIDAMIESAVLELKSLLNN